MSLHIQQQIRKNANEIRDYLDDLSKWQDTLEKPPKKKRKKKQKKVKKNSRNNSKEIPIRGAVNIEELNDESSNNKKLEKKNQKLIRDTNTIKGYYEAWDKINVDEELNKLEKDEDSHIKTNVQQEVFEKNLGAKKKKKAKISIKGGRGSLDYKYVSQKDLGNSKFKERKYDEAIKIYTDCVNEIQNEGDDFYKFKDIFVKVLANRAQAFINTGEFLKAIEDCNTILSIDQNFVKAYYRKSFAYKKIGNLRAALESIKSGLEVFPEEKSFLKEFKGLDKAIKIIKKKFLEKMEKVEIGQDYSFTKVKVLDYRVQGDEEETPIIQVKSEKKTKTKIDVDKMVKENKAQPKISEFLKLREIESYKKKSGEKKFEEKKGRKVRFRLSLEELESSKNKPKRRLRKKRPRKNLKPKKSILKKISKYQIIEQTTRRKEGNMVIEILEDKQEENLKKALKKLIGDYLNNINDIKTKTEFVQVWRSFNEDKKAKKFILKKMDLGHFKRLFSKSGMESETFESILEILKELKDGKKELEYLKLLSKTEGMDLNLMMMTKSEKKNFRKYFETLKSDSGSETEYKQLLESFSLS